MRRSFNEKTWLTCLPPMSDNYPKGVLREATANGRRSWIGNGEKCGPPPICFAPEN